MGPAINRAQSTYTLESNMKIKTNVRAGSGGTSTNSGGVNGGHSSQTNNTVGFYVPPISRCVGI